MKKYICISIDVEIFKKLEQMRGKKTQFRSEFINATLREKLGLPEKE